MSSARGHAVQAAAVGEAAPGGVDLGEVGVVAPVAAVDQLQQPGAVGARLGAEDPCGGASLVAVLGQVGLRVGADVVVLGGLVEAGDELHRVVEHRHHVREGVAEEAGDAHGDVDARAAELVERRSAPGSTTRRDASSQTGRTPSSASTSAMSSPAVRMADVPHTDSPTDCGQSPWSAR